MGFIKYYQTSRKQNSRVSDKDMKELTERKNIPPITIWTTLIIAKKKEESFKGQERYIVKPIYCGSGCSIEHKPSRLVLGAV